MSSKADALSSTILRSVLSFPNKGCSLACAGNEHEINYPSVTFCKNRELNAKHKEFIRKRRELCYTAGKYSNSDLTAWTRLFSLPDTWTMKAPRQPVYRGGCARSLPGEYLVCAAVLCPLSVTPKLCCFPFPTRFQLFSPGRRAWGLPGSSQGWGKLGMGQETQRNKLLTKTKKWWWWR